MGGYQIESPTVDWHVGEIAIAVRCDARGGGVATETGRRAHIGICGFSMKQITEKTKMLSCDMVMLYPGRVTKAQGCQHLVMMGESDRYFMVSTWPGC